jgi:hypothetical protein
MGREIKDIDTGTMSRGWFSVEVPRWRSFMQASGVFVGWVLRHFPEEKSAVL